MSVQGWKVEGVNTSMVRRKVLTALILVLPLAVGVITHVVCAPHLPERLPDPWDVPGLFPAGESVDSDAVYGGFFTSGLMVLAGLVITVCSKGAGGADGGSPACRGSPV